MGSAGRKPIPAEAIDNLSHKKNSEEIAMRKEIEAKLKTKAKLTVPKYLTDEAKKEWRRIMRLYNQMELKILNDLDITALVMYCEATAIYKKAQETWAKVNQVVSGNDAGQKMLDKTFTTMEKQSKIISKLAEQLCLTPVGRARIGNAHSKNKPKSDVLDLMNEED